MSSKLRPGWHETCDMGACKWLLMAVNMVKGWWQLVGRKVAGKIPWEDLGWNWK